MTGTDVLGGRIQAAGDRIRRLRPEWAVFAGVAVLVMFIVLWPLFWLMAGAFVSDSGDVSAQHWTAAFNAPFLGEAVVNTLIVSILGTAIAVAIGVPLAFFIARTDLPGRNVFELISLVPFITPPIVSGIAWTILGDREAGLLNLLIPDALGFRINVVSLGGLIFVSSLYMVPFVFFIAVGAMRQVNSELEEASVICGASKLQTFFRVTVPVLMPSIAGGALLAFMYSNNLFGIHAVIGMPAKEWMLTTAIYASMSIMPVDFHRAAIQGLILLAMCAVAMWMQAKVVGRANYATITGKGFRPHVIPLGHWRWPVAGLFWLYVFLVALLPYMVILLRSLSQFTFQPGTGFTDWISTWDLSEYANALFHDAASQRAIINSFWLSFVAALITVSLTSVVAYLVRRTEIPGRRLLAFVCMVPLTLPGVVLGAAVIFGYTTYPFALYGTIWIFLAAYVMKDLPLAYQTADTAYSRIHQELEESARVCGASWLQQFRTILLPLVKPGIVVGFVMVFASMMREVGASIMLFSPGNEIFAYTIFNAWEEGRWQLLTSFIMINSVIVLICVALFLRLTRLNFASLTARPSAAS